MSRLQLHRLLERHIFHVGLRRGASNVVPLCVAVRLCVEGLGD
jgi:hypothetical protein